MSLSMHPPLDRACSPSATSSSGLPLLRRRRRTSTAASRTPRSVTHEPLRVERNVGNRLPFLQPPFDVWTETPTGGTPNFLTGAGGFLQVWEREEAVPLYPCHACIALLQTAFSGYTGLRTNDTALTLGATLAHVARRLATPIHLYLPSVQPLASPRARRACSCAALPTSALASTSPTTRRRSP